MSENDKFDFACGWGHANCPVVLTDFNLNSAAISVHVCSSKLLYQVRNKLITGIFNRCWLLLIVTSSISKISQIFETNNLKKNDRFKVKNI